VRTGLDLLFSAYEGRTRLQDDRTLLGVLPLPGLTHDPDGIPPPDLDYAATLRRSPATTRRPIAQTASAQREKAPPRTLDPVHP
jgi:hypothetical protein